MTRAAKPQLPLQFTRRGGPRPGAGRPRKKDAGVSHLARPAFQRRTPVHATLRVGGAVPSLRGARCFAAVEKALAAARDRLGVRVVHFAVLCNHLHLIVEADGSESLSRGMQGLTIRLARALNSALERRGRVFADHYHSRLLRTPTEVANAIRYVRENFAHHFPELQHRVDPFSSAARPDLAAPPRTWLLTIGWQRARHRPHSPGRRTGREASHTNQ
jgi:putative transposase